MTTLSLSPTETRVSDNKPARSYWTETQLTETLVETPVVARRPASEEALLLAAEVVAAGGARNTLILAGTEAGVATIACALELGRALVQLGFGRVMVVEADGEHRAAEMPRTGSRTAGLVDVLTGAATLDRACVSLGNDLFLMPFAGKEEGLRLRATQLEGRALASMMDGLRTQYDFVLLATPALAKDAVTRLLCMHTNAVVLVAQRGRQTRSGLARLHTQLTSARIKTLGVVLV